MKIPLLLVQFLYKNRRLALPGIGIFTLDKSVVLPEENDRDLLSLPNAVQFQNANITVADKDLIAYIVANTGKITPLATSDLDSYLTLGMEMLNIGKPFYLEGIGTITRSKTGKFDFSPGEYTVIKENQAAGAPDHGKKRTPESVQPVSALQSPQNQNLLKFVAVVAALIIVGWGGYLMYKKMTPPVTENKITPVDSPSTASAETDSSVAPKQHDTGKITVPPEIHQATGNKDSTTYKFVILATDNKTYALKRYRQLISFDLNAHFFEKDSSFFKVYFQFPALVKDTVRIKDSLRRQYAHSVQIEE
ncbi:MAG: hypothetical protein Q8918_02735 [Bacteroidota bacterium]|nr:hypothetical protein [Bacteroidota bacterium]